MNRFVLNIFGNVIKFSVIVYIGYILLSTVFVFFFSGINKTIKNPAQYEKAYTTVRFKEKITHFPSTIPENAKNVKMYFYTSGSNNEVFLLEFNTDKKYIEQELRKNKFINFNSSDNQKIYHFYKGNGIKPDGYKFYVIDDEENRIYAKQYFPYFSGIGVNEDKDKILYYFFYPSD
ncbi:hypothetical protein IKQ21_09875 [bacterium]|nr:hypothetical protein [bacterium]